MNLDPDLLVDLGVRYTEAWCSREPDRVAAFFSETGSLTINGGTPAIGRAAISDVAASFMTAFPDMVLTMDCVRGNTTRAVYEWIFVGTNTGPGGSGKPVLFCGFEEWEIGDDGLIASSLGNFDETDYQRQLSIAP